jgi:serine/threonine protein kinase
LIPEPAIWHIFETLIKAGLVMERGAEGPQSPPWFIGGPVVHLDIKPSNVFISDCPAQTTANGQPPDNFAMYPRFKLSDFGLSIDNRRFPRADREYRGRGTPGFLPPEQLQEDDYPGQNQDPLNSKTNVWGVGITMMVMMNMDDEAGELDFAEAETDERDPNLVPRFKQRALNVYSQTLTNMVLSCVQFLQANRPTFDTLLTTLRNATNHQPGALPVDHALGARHATSTNLPGTLQPLMYLGTVDAYAVGLTMPPGHTAI